MYIVRRLSSPKISSPFSRAARPMPYMLPHNPSQSGPAKSALQCLLRARQKPPLSWILDDDTMNARQHALKYFFRRPSALRNFNRVLASVDNHSGTSILDSSWIAQAISSYHKSFGSRKAHSFSSVAASKLSFSTCWYEIFQVVNMLL
ncbi:hypothetical protein KCV06_g656, partial [Aureobasidium melanogenum]